MKVNQILGAALVAASIVGCASNEDLQRQAKISKVEALATAQKLVPNGTTKESELEREHGKTIWSFEFTTPDSKEITEVNVDAMTGSVVNVEHEKP